MGRGGQLLETMPEVAAAPANRFRVTLYRAGLLENPAHYGVAEESYLRADALRPADGRPGRRDGLFCSVGLNGLSRWLRGNRSCNLPADPWEIRYDGPEPFAYPVAVWEAASSLNSDQGYCGYWNCGLPVSQLLADPLTYRDSSWEVLIDPAHIRSARPVSLRRLIAGTASRGDAEELMRDFFPGLYRKGIVFGSEQRQEQPHYDRADDLAHRLMVELRQSGRGL